MQHLKHPPAIKLVYPATAKRDVGHGVADATKMTLSALSIVTTDYGCGNLKPLTERTEISLMPRESWEVLDCSESDEGDQSSGEIQAPMPAVVQNQQIRTRRQRKEQTGK